MTLYETLFIIHPEKGGRVKEFIDRFKKVVEGLDGVVAHVEEWGLKDLAYRIEKQGKGFYTLLRYRSSSRAVEELERNLKLTDDVLRYLTVRLDEEVETKADPKAKSPTEETKKASEEDVAKPESHP